MARKPKGEEPVAPATSTRSSRTPIHQIHPASSAETVVDDDTRMEDRNDVRSNNTLDEDAGLELLGQGMKALVTLVQNLRDLGVEDLVLPLPKICVLGDQSTGKSSLVEGISGIKVPRSSGTCTRCVLEINLSASDANTPWRCSVYLQKAYIYEGSQAATARGERATRARPLGPWVAQGLPESSLFFKTTNKADVPQALWLAQLATLNPSSDPAKYFPGAKIRPDDRIQVKFSPNVVRVDISAPELPNLSFYDLPGIINQAEVPEEEYLCKLVVNLAKTYAGNDSCINLLAIPMTDDAANSTASKLVQELDAQHRTIGVLTKPDRVQSGESMTQWVDILDGRKFRLGHGYYVVKNNSNPEVSNAVAREEEDQFFENEPWVRTLGSHFDRFGTFKLQTMLSKLLKAQIRTSLPTITERVRSKTQEIIARLKDLPEPPEGNLSLKIYEKILQFEADLRCHLDGGSEMYPFQKEVHAAAIQFRNTIAFSYPRLSLADLVAATRPSSQLPYRSSATPTPSGNRRSEIIIDSDEEDRAAQKFPQTPSPIKRKQAVSNSTPSKRSRLENIPQFLPGQDLNGSNSSSSSSMNLDRTAPFARRFTLAEIRSILEDAHIGLPNQVDPRATKRMITYSLSHWDEPLKAFLTFTSQTCRSMILDRASSVFSLWQGTQCFDELLELCYSFFDECRDKQMSSARRILAIERQAALTLHEDAMRTASERALVTLEHACRSERAKALLMKQDPEWEENVSDRTKNEKISKVDDAQLGPNPFTNELRAMADVRGYYECAFSRFVDVIYQGIQAEIVTACRNDLGTALKERLGLADKDAEQRCAVLLAVDPENARIRAELERQKENLEKAVLLFDLQ
ncbi:MAG: hypothetical protein Q9223_005679 [Gallowayella weberi]